MTNLSERSWAVSLAYLSCRDEKNRDVRGFWKPSRYPQLGEGSLDTLDSFFCSKGIQFGGETSKFGIVVSSMTCCWQLLTSPKQHGWQRVYVCAFAYSRERVSACDRPESECGRRVTEERHWVDQGVDRRVKWLQKESEAKHYSDYQGLILKLIVYASIVLPVRKYSKTELPRV